jgi:FlaA1/EpsC-like NDP-sugar epimerase
MDILKIIGRDKPLIQDLSKFENKLRDEIKNARFLVIGGAGSIGQAVVQEIFFRNPLKLHVVDISENNLVELVRDIRSSKGYISGDFRTFALDVGSHEFKSYFKIEGPFDYVLNLSALKHVRSESDPYTLMRMTEVNILNTIDTIEMSIKAKVKKYFCVSTDKATNPVNMMGASKRIMEMYLSKYMNHIAISTARFANVAFSDGSLLHGFRKRLENNQPIAAPNDILRYFITSQEAGEICLMSTIFGKTGDIYFPKLSDELDLISFSQIAKRFLEAHGLITYECESESEARDMIASLINTDKWPCFFSTSDTTGEKEYEEFYGHDEEVDFDEYNSLGIVRHIAKATESQLDHFLTALDTLRVRGRWVRDDIIQLYSGLLPNFNHIEKGQYLDGKM